jgi:hypothetical protein
MVPALTQLGWAAAVAVVGIVSTLLGSGEFSPTACSRFEPYLNSYLVGQGPSIKFLADAVCDFLDKDAKHDMPSSVSAAPLVVSLHGPPGVGKTYFHKLAAHVLYNVESKGSEGGRGCPGRACPGYKVLFGMDYTSHDRDLQHRLLQNSLLDHVSTHPQSLIVVEEYDKLDCHMRGFFRQILQGNSVGNQSLGQSIVVLESNLGHSALHGLLDNDSGRRKREDIDMRDAQKALKDMVFVMWQEQGCEEFSDSQKLIRSIDHFLPFYPLEREHIVELFHKKLKGYGDAGRSEFGGSVDLMCDDQCVKEVIPFLLDKVEFDDGYPIEGGKEVNTVSTGYLSRPFREWIGHIRQKTLEAKKEQRKHANEEYTWHIIDNAVSIVPRSSA